MRKSDDYNLHQAYKELTEFLIKSGLTITTMESCTSGFIASLITDTEGASAVIKGAYITYSNEAKELNGVSADIINKFGVYSKETAEAMSDACRKKYDADISIGVTGTFGNVDPKNNDSVPGEVYISIKTNADLYTEKIKIPAKLSRLESKKYVAMQVASVIQSFCKY